MSSSEARHHLTSWAGLLAGPVAWFLQFQVAYWLTPRVCAGMGRLPLHVATLTGLLIAAGGSWAAWSNWRTAGREWPSDCDEERIGRIRFLSVQGVMAGLLFSLVISAQWMAIVFLDPCPP